MMMNRRKLGKANLDVSDVGHGLWGMGSWSGSDDDVSRAALRFSIVCGCTFFDSAYVYGEGRSDRLLGEVAADYPERNLVLASKIPPANFTWPSSPKNALKDIFPREHVLKYADIIRRALGRPIDVLQFHLWEDIWAGEAEWQDTVHELKASGTIKSFGISVNRWQPENVLAAIETGLVETVQVVYNIFDQAPEDVLFPACRKHNVGVIARVPLDEGSLTGTLTLDTKFPDGDWRAGYFNAETLPEIVKRVDALKELLPEGMTLPEMALRFILSEPTVSTLIAGMRDSKHVRDNLAVSDKGPLPESLRDALRNHRWERTRVIP
jgi:aryl-alcohol dehydrogenase-like predicted oxidoreductase